MATGSSSGATSTTSPSRTGRFSIRGSEKRIRATSEPALLSEQLRQLGFGLVDFGGVGWNVGRGSRLEVITEVRASLVAHLFRSRLPAMLCNAGVMIAPQ